MKSTLRTLSLASTLIALLAIPAQAQPKVVTPSGPIDFEEYEPVSTLKVSEHKLTKAKYPFIDVHNHQFEMDHADLRNLVSQMDSLNMGIMVNLSGRGFANDVSASTRFMSALPASDSKKASFSSVWM